MKFFKIIFLTFLLILPANANTIYNLIKIPNLEIYNNKSPNGIKYLNATKPFQVGIRNDNVTCFNSSNQNMNEKFELIERNFNKYSSDFLKKINLKYVVLCENLSVSQINSAGVPNYSMRTLIIDIKFSKKYFERVIHHEIFHLVNEGYKNYFKNSEWEKFNNSNFKYAECSTCSDRLNLSLLDKTEGFLTEYSMSTPSEDMAEIFSFLIIDKKKIENKALRDPILSKKISYIKKNIIKIDQNFKF
tara:strand:- start:2130 stop:2867 length:738 start_codon:yes stop_codon:yes gene_type:complete